MAAGKTVCEQCPEGTSPDPTHGFCRGDAVLTLGAEQIFIGNLTGVVGDIPGYT